MRRDVLRHDWRDVALAARSGAWQRGPRDGRRIRLDWSDGLPAISERRNDEQPDQPEKEPERGAKPHVMPFAFAALVASDPAENSNDQVNDCHSATQYRQNRANLDPYGLPKCKG